MEEDDEFWKWWEENVLPYEKKEEMEMRRDHEGFSEVFELLCEARKLWEEVKDAHYDDFWQGWEPSPLRQRCRVFLKRSQNFFERLRERARKEGAKKPPEGPYLKFGFNIDVDILDSESSLFGRTYERYLSVSKEFAAMFRELQELARRIEDKLDDYRFCE